MKVTWVKGNLSSGKPVELDTVVEYMKDAAKAKPVKNMREMIHYCSPGSRAADAEKVPVILFASGYKEQEWKCYNGLVLLEFARLANIFYTKAALATLTPSELPYSYPVAFMQSISSD